MALAPSLLVAVSSGRIISGTNLIELPDRQWRTSRTSRPPEQRAGKFGMLGAAFGIGFVVGPAIGGFARRHRLAAPVLDCGGTEFGECRVWIFFLPESLPRRERRAPPKLAESESGGLTHFNCASHPELASPRELATTLMALAHG